MHAKMHMEDLELVEPAMERKCHLLTRRKLCNNLSSIQQAKLQSVEDIIKGKSPVVDISPKPILA